MRRRKGANFLQFGMTRGRKPIEKSKDREFGMKRGRKPIDKSKDSEDWCFKCKEGGELDICDYGGCLKTYHKQCIDESLKDKEPFECERHFCWECKKRTPLIRQCYCCPRAVCLRCINPAEFVCIRKKYGFCWECLNLVLLIEENRDVASNGVTVDFKDIETCEGLFMDYYIRVIKKNTRLTIEKLRAAKDKLMTGNYELDDVDVDEEDDEMESDYEVMDTEEVFGQKRRRKLKNDLHLKKPKYAKSKEMQFTGWGSALLIQFLKSIDEDTSKELNQRKVETIIIAYVNKNKLFDPNDKKKIRCDEKLLALFGRKCVKRGKIYELLESHFANDLDISEEDEDLEEEITFDGTEVGLGTRKTRRNLTEDKDPLKVKEDCSVSESCFAAISAENIKLIYLRRSLLQELSKEPESFEKKVKGSYIRLKTDPNDRFQRNSHQLVQVTGVKKTSSGQSNEEMVLHVSNMSFEIHIGSLSDADIEEAECADLGQKVKDGLMKKPTVVELQEKARSLHEDITKNWIARELKLLESRINQANDKGRRQEMSDYIEKRKLLQDQSEQLRLLQTYPTVKAEVLEASSEENQFNRKEDEASPQSVHSTGLKCKWGNSATSRGKKYPGQVSGENGKQRCVSPPLPTSADQGWSTWRSNRTIAATVEGLQYQGPTSESQIKGNFLGEDGIQCSSATGLKQNQGSASEQAATKKRNKTGATTLEGSPHQVPTSEVQCNAKVQVKEKRSSSGKKLKQNEEIKTEDTTPKKIGPSDEKAIVDLSSDDDSIICCGSSSRKQHLEDLHSRVWLVVGPDGDRKGPYTLSLLRTWGKASPYALKFKAWKQTQTEGEAIWLGDAIKLTFDEH